MTKPIIGLANNNSVGFESENPIRVLHVDDDSNFLVVAKRILEMQGPFQVDSALSVKEAYEKMKEKEFDVILSDYQMPIKDGLQFLKELKNNGNNIPFILFTGKGREEVAIEALNLGAHRYFNKIGKPQTVYGKLGHAIRQVVKSQKSMDALLFEQSLIRTLLEYSQDFIYFKDQKARYVRLSERYLDFFKLCKEDIIGKTALDLFSGDIGKQIYDEELQLIKTGKPIINKEETANGIWVLTTTIPWIDKNGKIVGLFGISRDITERKKTENEKVNLIHDLGERVKELRCLYEISKLAEEPNISLEKLLQKTTNLLPPAWQYPEITCTRIVFDNQEYKTKNFKETRWKQSSDIRVNGTKSGIVEVSYLEEKPESAEGPFLKEERALIDAVAERLGRIVERKKAEQALDESEEKYKHIVELAPDSIITANAKGVVTSVNIKFTRLTGFSKVEIVGKHFTKVGTIRKRDLPKFLKVFTSLLRGKAPKPFEVMWKHKDGTVHPTEIHVTLVKSDGKTIGFQAIARDITERKKMKEKILEQNEFLNSALDSLTHPFYVIKADDYTIQLANTASGFDTSKKLICYEVTHKQKKPCSDEHPCPLEIVKKTKKPAVTEHIHYGKDGNPRNVEVHGYPIFDNDGNVFQMIEYCLDITERKKDIEVLRKVKERYSSLIQNIPGMIYSAAPDWSTKMISNSQEITGYPNEEFNSGKVNWFNLIHPDDKSRMLEESSEIVEQPKSVVQEYRVVDKDGVIRFVEDHKTSFHSKVGIFEGVAGIVFDVSERKKDEESLNKTMNDLALVNEKLGVVGRLTRHDVRNKLSAVTGNIYLAKQTLSSDSETVKYLNETESAVDQIERIFDFARIYEQLGVEELSDIDAGKCFDDAVSLVSSQNGIDFVNECRGLLVLADSLLSQLLFTMINNSLRHGEKVSRIRIHHKVGEDLLKIFIEDDGIGIPKEEKEIIFKEGYGKGSGFGLHLVKLMCKVYGWTIKETGKQGKGAQFTITIPKMNPKGKSRL